MEIGHVAPEFYLLDQHGEERCLENYRGRWVLLYFYPKDDTPGCTKEACGIRDYWNEFGKHTAVVLGVSGDSVKKHKAFVDKYGLPFILLADEDREVIKKYGVLKEKKMFGKSYMGISRESFLINPDGVMVKHYNNVKPAEHAKQVLKDLKAFMRD